MAEHSCSSFEKPDVENIFSAVANGDTDAVRHYIVDLGVDVNSRDGNSLTPLHYSAKFNQVDVARLLIELGAKADITNNCGKTPLQVAEKHGRDEIAKLIKDK